MRYCNRPFEVHRKDSYFVELEIDEWAESAHMAVNRQVASERAGLQHTYGSTRDMDREMASMHAELAFSIFTGEKWHQHERDATQRIENVHGPDVGGFQVRQAAGGKNRSLLVRSGDSGDDLFFLILGWHRLYEIVGWMRGDEAKVDRHVSAPDPTRPVIWMVPPDKLHPVSALIPDAKDRFVEKRTIAVVRTAWKERYGKVSEAG